MLDKRTDGSSSSTGLHGDSGLEDYGNNPDTSLGDNASDMEY
jgi:hypothetical protein